MWAAVKADDVTTEWIVLELPDESGFLKVKYFHTLRQVFDSLQHTDLKWWEGKVMICPVTGPVANRVVDTESEKCFIATQSNLKFKAEHEEEEMKREKQRGISKGLKNLAEARQNYVPPLSSRYRVEDRPLHYSTYRGKPIEPEELKKRDGVEFRDNAMRLEKHGEDHFLRANKLTPEQRKRLGWGGN